MKITHISAELAPVAKVGGLADVLHGLSRALIAKGHDVTIVMPKYDTLDEGHIKDLERVTERLPIFFDGMPCHNTVWKGWVDGVPVIFIESHDPKEFFRRGSIYGSLDDTARFTYFCAAAIAYIKRVPADVIHLHDWHTALIAPLIKEIHPQIKSKIILTIHNLSYQGLCRGEDLDKIGWKSPLLKEGGVYNLLKGGVVFADHITTVSPNYAQEILTTELGGNLQSTLLLHQHKLSGVLNGIDFSYWNPETDPFLPANYSYSQLKNKEIVKEKLKKKLSLTDAKAPIVSAITRLVPQKGPELIKAAILRTLEWGGQFVLLGSALDEKTELHFANLKRTLAGCRYVHFELTFNEELSHLVFAASDLFLAPSIFEPCGLTQMISMRYGTVPLVRETGGFVDTVCEGKNGFTFQPPTAEAIHEAIDRALHTWHHNPKQWQKLIEAGMKSDFSWDKPANAYLNIYQYPLDTVV